MTQRAKEGQRLLFAKGSLGQQPVAPPRPPSDRGHVGLSPGFVDEDQPPGIEPPLILLPLFPSPRDLGAILLGGEQRLFEAEPSAAQLMHHRIVADIEAPGAQLVRPRANRQVRAGLQPSEQPCLLTGKSAGTSTNHRLRRSAARSAPPLRPLHCARHAHAKRRCHFPAGSARQYRTSNTLAQITGIRLGHACRPPTPASSLNLTCSPTCYHSEVESFHC